MKKYRVLKMIAKREINATTKYGQKKKEYASRLWLPWLHDRYLSTVEKEGKPRRKIVKKKPKYYYLRKTVNLYLDDLYTKLFITVS